jgi:hypothetical protein
MCGVVISGDTVEVCASSCICIVEVSVGASSCFRMYIIVNISMSERDGRYSFQLSFSYFRAFIFDLLQSTFSFVLCAIILYPK